MAVDLVLQVGDVKVIRNGLSRRNRVLAQALPVGGCTPGVAAAAPINVTRFHRNDKSPY